MLSIAWAHSKYSMSLIFFRVLSLVKSIAIRKWLKIGFLLYRAHVCVCVCARARVCVRARLCMCLGAEIGDLHLLQFCN